jgi:hypothetical protein
LAASVLSSNVPSSSFTFASVSFILMNCSSSAPSAFFIFTIDVYDATCRGL